MKNWTLIALMFILLGNTGHSQCAKIDVVFLIDMSASVKGNEAFMTKALNAFVSKFPLNEEGIKLSIITFSHGAKSYLPLTADSVKARQAIYEFSRTPTQTNTDLNSGLQRAQMEIEDNGRDDVTKMIIVISDGDVDLPDESLYITELIKQSIYINICSIFINGSDGRAFMKRIATGSCYSEASYETLHKVLKELDLCI